MRIAVWHDPPSGGARRAIDELLHRLARRHTVDLYRQVNRSGLVPMAPPDGVRVEDIPFQPRTQRRLGFYWNDVLTYRDLLDLDRRERTLASRIDEGDYDLALVSVLRTGQAPSALTYLRTPTVYYCHEPPRRFWEPWCRPEAAPLSRYERLRLLWRWPTRSLIDSAIRRRDQRNVRRANLVLTNSEYTRRRIEAVYSRDATVCYLGVDSERFQPPAKRPATQSVVSVGALEAHKGFDFVIRALGAIPAERRPDLTIVGASGHSRMPAYLQQLADQSQVRLQIRQAVSDADLQAIYRRSALFVFGAHQEPFGLVLLEAMASGLPVVAVREGGVPEIVQHGQTGLLVSRDEVAFGAAVDTVLQDADRLRRLGANARQDVEKRWSWDNASDRLEWHFGQVGASHSRTPRLERI